MWVYLITDQNLLLTGKLGLQYSYFISDFSLYLVTLYPVSIVLKIGGLGM